MVDTNPRKRPVQGRAQATVDAIVQAAAHILDAEGPEGLNTNRIAEVAGVSIGSLYQYFPSKEAVVAGLVEHLLERDRASFEQTLAALAETELRTVLREVCRAVCERQHGLAGVLQHLLPRLSQLDREAFVQREMDEVLAVFRAFVAPRTAELREELRNDARRLDDAIFVAGHGLRGALNAATLDRSDRLRAPEFWELLSRPLCAVLLPDPGDLSGTG